MNVGKPVPLKTRAGVKLSLAGTAVTAGFPSPAEDYVEKRLDLSELLVHNKASSFIFRAAGDSMIDAKIFDGDYLVVDRSVDARDGQIVIAIVGGEHVVKTLRRRNSQVWLAAANPKFADIAVTDEDATIFGVVTGTVRVFPR